MTDHRFTLSFKLITCQGCGVSRIRGVSCADCGARARPWEVDPELQRRQTLMQELMLVLAARDTNQAPASVFDFIQDHIFDRIGSWISQFLHSLAEAVESKYRNTGSLRDAVTEFLELSTLIQNGSPTRPFVRAHVAARQVVDLGRSLIEEYLSALQSSTPIEAQRHADAAQSNLDELAAVADGLSSWLSRFEVLSAPAEVGESLGALVSDAMSQSSTRDLVELDRSFRARLESATGLAVEPGLGVTYAMYSSLASVYFDENRFHSSLHGYVDLLLHNPERLDAILKNETFVRDIKRVELELFDSAMACQRILVETRLARQAARSIVELHGTLVESAGLIVCSSILVATGRKTAAYESLRRKNATELLTSAQSHPDLAPLLLGLDGHLRTAQAHRGITYHDDHITTDMKSGQHEYTFDELVDKTYAAMESMLAALLSIRLIASTMGAEFDDSLRLQALGMTSAEIAEFTLRSFGHSCDVSLQAGDDLVIELDAAGAEGLSPALGALTAHLDEEVLTFVVHISGHPELRCAVGAYRAFQMATDEFEKLLALMRIQAAWTGREPEEGLNLARLRKWSAVQASEIIDQELGSQIRILRSLREFARDFGDDDLASALTSLIRIRRLEGTPTAAGEAEMKDLRRIIDWGQASVDFDLI
jgi:hypothetical protein